jgi:hypothetical protein
MHGRRSIVPVRSSPVWKRRAPRQQRVEGMLMRIRRTFRRQQPPPFLPWLHTTCWAQDRYPSRPSLILPMRRAAAPTRLRGCSRGRWRRSSGHHRRREPPGCRRQSATDASHAAPDGHTLLIGNQGPMVVSPHLYKTMKSDPTVARAHHAHRQRVAGDRRRPGSRRRRWQSWWRRRSDRGAHLRVRVACPAATWQHCCWNARPASRRGT